MSTRDWHAYVVCKCGYRRRAPFGDADRETVLFHTHVAVCPDCGAGKHTWSIEVCRWVDDSVWWKPGTWGKGRWVLKADTESKKGK